MNRPNSNWIDQFVFVGMALFFAALVCTIGMIINKDFQVYAMPVMETFLVKYMKFAPSFGLRFTTRTFFVAFTMFVAITFPFFGGLDGFFGGFALAPTTYFLPASVINTLRLKRLEFIKDISDRVNY